MIETVAPGEKIIQRDTVRDQVKRLLLARILDGTYKPGDRLVELQIARELDASQGSVREALRELEALRVVETQTYRGTRVRGVNAAEMREAYQVRSCLEDLAAKLAAPVFKGNVSELQREVNALRSAAKTQDADAYATHNQKLHRQIIEAAGNSILLRVWDSLDMEARSRIALARPNIDLRVAVEAHQAIVDAFEQGDGKLAGKLLREHAERCSKHIEETELVQETTKRARLRAIG
ncbi:MAG: GntR family transcriptional regulator [Acidobacteriaceae bacterium]|nr:GntR family transcriptional regulator [Acidobacteriaceae bacterium]